ncbi:MAG TPA: response regulator [Methylomirabilota bacterium]|nr:response regulator [Methylomirabilota bacterium]
MAAIILVGEDDKFLGKVFLAKLSAAGFDVTLAENGQEVLEKARLKKPDLLLLDLIMPVKDGFETLQELRADPNLKDIKVIITSTLQQPEDLAKTKQLGASGYLNKEDIHAIVQNVQKFL